MMHVCARFVVSRIFQCAPQSPVRVGLKEGSEFFSLRCIGNK